LYWDEILRASDIIMAAEYINSRTGSSTFFTNFIPDIEKVFNAQPKGEINFDVFRQKKNLIHFIIWPAF
jgi:hypothetical protein